MRKYMIQYWGPDTEWVILIVGLIVLGMVISSANKKARRKSLMAKYRDEKIVNRIIEKTIWQGETEHQLLDSLGKAAAIDQKVLKTKTKEIWKYYPRDARSYGLRVTVEDGIIVGWDSKG